MDSFDNSNQKKRRLVRSFGYAINGIRTAIVKERNLQIHVGMAITAVLCGFIFQITKVEWLFIILAIGGTFTAEMMNSAIERVVDLSTEDFHPLARDAKDMAAGAVLLFALTSVVIGIVIFVPKVVKLLI